MVAVVAVVVEDAARNATATVAFERDLESLVLRSFAEGAAIEGSWNVELSVPGAPDWTVEIRRRGTDDGEAYEPELPGE